MTIISRAIPGLFGGVSQQIPAMRHPTQCDEQVNGLSTVVAGLFKRPGSKHITQLAPLWSAGDPLAGNVHCHVIDREAGSRWMVVMTADAVHVVNLETGTTEPVEYRTAAGAPTTRPSYLNATNPAKAFRVITVADTTFLVNSEVTVGSVNTDASTPLSTRGYVYIRTGVQQHTYTIRVNGADANFTAGTTTTVKTVKDGLVAAINALGGGRSASGVAGVEGLIEVNFTSDIQLSATDTYGNSTMTVVTNGVQRFSELPPGFVSGRRVTITGSEAVGGNVDPYYVEWVNNQWREVRAYGMDTGLNPATMPHRMWRDSGTWVIQPVTWEDRLVGDDDTNPMPSFVGRSIRDIFFYRNRLGVLAGDSLVLSRAGRYFNFFSTTAREILDTDPIDLGGSAESVDTLDWAVPFNQKLIVWASYKQQFVLEGGDILSPNTARLVPTTAFESVNTARPKQLGNRIVFPSTINGFTQMGLYRVSQDTVSNTAETITDHVPTYIPVEPRSIELSETAKVLAVVPPGAGNDLYVFKYEDDGDKLSQRAWQKFTFEGGIVKAHWSGQMLYLALVYPNATQDGKTVMCLEAIDFSDTAVDPSLSFGMRLDRRVFVNGATPTETFGEYEFTATLPFTEGLEVFRYSGASDPVKLQVVSTTVNPGSPTTVTFRVKSPAAEGTYVVGQPYTFRYTFTEVFMRDGDGVPVMDSRLKLLKMYVRFVKTGYFKAKVSTKARGQYEYDSYGYSVNGQGVGLLDQLLGALPVLIEGDYSIPIHAQAAGTKVTLESDSHLPCCFPYAEWRGNIVMKAKR